MNKIDQRLAALRREMAESRLDAYIIPSNDPHQSEYVADYWKAREWISGFSGSAGVAVVTREHAGLWTDSRYFLQAEAELEASEFELHPQKVPHAPEHVDWLKEKLKEGSTVGCDGQVFSATQLDYLSRQLGPHNIEVSHTESLIGRIWERPNMPRSQVFELAADIAGERRLDKLARVRSAMGKAPYYLVATLDDIAWVLNIRAADVEFNPVCISYLLIGQKQAHWFVQRDRVPATLRDELEREGIRMHPYESLEDFLGSLSGAEKLRFDPASTAVNIYESLDEEQWVKSKNLIRPLKAIKNATEIRHLRSAMRKDGLALIKLYRWLETALEGPAAVTEYEIAERLSALRSEQGNYYGESFGAIVGYAANGAIVHYRAESGSSAKIRKEGLLLIDSGGQYKEGTTDITRTISLGTPTAAQRRHNTLVLKGHIALARAVFPEGTTGVQLDILARLFLWQDHLNYGHGTGHGVGFFLNVHEPPQGITPNPKGERGTTAFRPGMLTSNEPGYYETGAYGIRIENLILCVEAEPTNTDTPFYRFETLTLFPISLKLADTSLLDEEERRWLNDYHQRVFQELAPLTNEEEKQWLASRCQPI